MPDDKSRLVFSTDNPLPRKEKSVRKTPQASLPAAQKKMTVRLERKGRGGKTVTVIDGLLMQQGKMEELLKQLKSRPGTGGTVKDESLEIQGDHRDKIIVELNGMGFAPKRSGG